MSNKHREFWNREYQTSEHLTLSSAPSEDLEKFTRFLERGWKREFLNPRALALDLGCGNGRNLIYLAESFGMRGVGYDISDVAIKAAKAASEGMPIEYETLSIEGELPMRDTSATIVLDMMTSHFLKKAEREALKAEILRVLRPGGWLFFKSFLADEDLNVKRLLRESPADEEGAYIHPKMGVYEYVWTEDALREFFEPDFEIHKIHKSHKHLRKGKPGKRRTLSAYMQKF
jgi:SAM-dependent methyltransferase